MFHPHKWGKFWQQDVEPTIVTLNSVISDIAVRTVIEGDRCQHVLVNLSG